MNCKYVEDSLESYISGDLDDATTSAVAQHLRTCEECAKRYDRTRSLIGDLKTLKGAFVPMEVFNMAQTNRTARPGVSWGWKFSTAFAMTVAALALTALTVPAVAESIPALPVGRQLSSLEADNERLADEIAALEIRIREIEGVKVPVVETAEPELPADVNEAVMSLAMRFVRAQYAGDTEALATMGTDRLRADLAANPEDYLRDGGEAVFAQMTDVSSSGEAFLVFVRLSDSGQWSDGQYQENFEIIKVGDEYLVDFMGMDA
jgi:hypothetical protein